MVVNPDPKFATPHDWFPVWIQEPLLEVDQILRRGPLHGVHVTGPRVHSVGLTKSVVRLEIQNAIALALNLFPDKDATTNHTFLV